MSADGGPLEPERPVEPERPLARQVSRRALFTGWRSTKEPTPTPPDETALADETTLPTVLERPEPPTPQSISADHSSMISFGPRVAGSRAHNDFISWLKVEFERAGCYERSSIDHPERVWLPRAWGLKITSGSDAGDVPVASCWARSGGFEPEGTSKDAPAIGPLLYLGQAPRPEMDPIALIPGARSRLAFQEWYRAQTARLGPAVDGTIVVIDLAGPDPVTQAEVASLTGCYHTQSPDHVEWPDWNQQRAWSKIWMLPDAQIPASSGGGPIGAIFIVDASYDALVGQSLPPRGAASTIPALLLDREAGARVRRAASAETAPHAELTLSATSVLAAAPSVVFKLAGTDEERLRGPAQDVEDALADEVEYVVINTHSDGVSIAQENGCLALLGLARIAGALKHDGKGMRRTLVFSAVTGRSDEDRSAQTQRFLDAHPEIARRMAFGMTAEHLGCTEWVDDADQGFRPTGLPEPAVMYHHEGLTPLVYGSYIERPLLNQSLSNGSGVYLGAGGLLAEVAPSVSLIAGPTYLHQAGADLATGGHLDQLDPELCARQYAWLADILAGFERLPFRGQGVFAPSP